MRKHWRQGRFFLRSPVLRLGHNRSWKIKDVSGGDRKFCCPNRGNEYDRERMDGKIVPRRTFRRWGHAEVGIHG